jgi:hypothetical protein
MIRRWIEQLGMRIGGRVGAKLYDFGGAKRQCYKNQRRFI